MGSLLSKTAFTTFGNSNNQAVSRAIKLADIYIASNTDNRGKVADPSVYQTAIATYLAPYVNDLSVQKKIAGYQNSSKSLSASQQDSENSVAALKLKEQGSWIYDEDQNSSSFRNSSLVANSISENLDMLVAETVATINEKQAANKDISGLQGYLNELSPKADRMRSLSAQLDSGQPQTLDGYGYFVDSDPTTGVIRGTSIMPTDMLPQEQKSKVRTDSFVNINGTRIPIYLPTIKDAGGSYLSNLGGKQYSGDTNLLTGGGEEDVSFAKDPSGYSPYKFDGVNLERGRIYKSYTGQSYQDGSPKQKYFYRGFDDQVYSFNDNDPNGQKFLSSMSAGGVVNKDNIPRINPYLASTIQGKSLTESSKDLSILPLRLAQIEQQNAPIMAEAQARESQGWVANLKQGFTSAFIKPVQSFFSRKNRQSVPSNPAISSSTPDVINQGKDIFNAQ